jgi:cell volume regulation protein A
LFGILVTESRRLPSWVFIFGKPQPAVGREQAHQALQWFHEEMTFLVRTFFFVYLGLLFEAERLTPFIVGASCALCLAIIVGRWSSVYLLRRTFAGHPVQFLNLFLPRGLVSAVLATLPATHHIRGTERFLDYTVPVIILTNLIMAAGLIASRKAETTA